MAPGDRLSGHRKSAILLISLGAQSAGEILKNLSEKEVEGISVEIARLQNVPSESMETVLDEFHHMSLAQNYIANGGLGFAREALEQAVGQRQAEEIIMRVEAAMEVSAFHLLQTVETGQLTNFLQNEHPQTAALIMAHLTPRKAAEILQSFEAQFQIEVMHRLATMGKTSPELLSDIEEVIRQQMGSVIGTQLSVAGGVSSVAEIMNSISRSTEKGIMEALRARDAELANSIKNLMFVFDDLVHISDRDLQRLLTEVDQKELALSLKSASEELKDKVLENMSDRAAGMLQEEMDLLGPVRLKDVEEAQRQILDTAHVLEDQDEIALTRGGQDVLV